MLWNEFIKLNHISKLSLNEQMRKFNEHIIYEEQVVGGIVSVPVTITNEDIGIITNLFINGILNQTQTGTGSKTVRVAAGSRFSISIPSDPGYDATEYYLRNNGIQIDYKNSQSGGFPIISPTFTAVPGGNYVFTCNGYST